MTLHLFHKSRQRLPRLLVGLLVAVAAFTAGPVLTAHKAPPPPISFTTWHMHDDWNGISSWFIVGEDQDKDGDVDFMGLANSGGGNAQMFITNGAAQGYTNPDGTPRLFPSATDFHRAIVKFWDGNGDGYYGYVVTDGDFGLAYRDRTAAGLDPAGEQQIVVPAPAAGPGRTGLMSHLDVGDIDGNGTTDVVAIGSRWNPNIRVFYNQGGTLIPGAIIPYPGGDWDGSGVRLADFDGDGKLDIVFTKLSYPNSPAPTYNVYRNNGDGTFTGFSLPMSLSAMGLAIGDANGDGKPDVFIDAYPAQLDAGSNWIAGTRGIYLFTNTSTPGNISFSVSKVVSTDDAHFIVAMDAGDLNGDGFADLVFAVSNGDSSASQHPEAWAGDGAGNFALAWTDTGANVVVDTMTIIKYNGQPALVGGGYRGAYLFANFNTATPPVVTVPGNLTAEATSAAGAAVTFAASASDGSGSVPVTCVPASGSTFALGTTPVTCSASNAGGDGSASFNVTVVDTTAPSLSLPSPMSVEATGPSGAAATYTASASDLVSGVVTPSCVPSSGSTFPIGTTTVNCSATDGAGNTASGSFTVTVADHTAPVATASLVRVGHGGGDDESMQFFQVVFSATDAVGVATLSADLNGIRVTNGQIVQLQTTNHAPRAKRDDGRLQIRAASFLLTVTATDAAGNTGSATAVPVFVKNGRDGEDHHGKDGDHDKGKGDDKGKGKGGDR